MSSTQWFRRAAAAGGVLTVSFWAAGLASADPMSEALATTTCNYGQVTAAMDAQAPELAAQLNLRPDMQANLQSFLALSVDERRQRIAEQQSATSPQMQQILENLIGADVSRVASSCMNY